MDTLMRTPNLVFSDHYIMHMVHAQKMVRATVLHVFVLASHGIPEKLMKHIKVSIY